MSWSQEVFQNAFAKVSARAAVDVEFRALVVSDIHSAIRQETGLEVPATFTIGVLDQGASQLNLILPPMKKEADELSESELENVAGGSKAGANDFFEGVATGAAFIMGADQNQHANNAEGTAGNIIGQVLAAPVKLIG